MIWPSKNPLNCWDILLDIYRKPCIMDNRTISSQAFGKLNEGSTTNESNLSHPSDDMEKSTRAGGLKMAARKFFVSSEQLKKDYEKIGNVRILADMYGVDHNIVSRNMKKFGISFNGKKMGDIIDFERLSKQGWSSKQLSRYFSCTEVCVNQVKRKNGWLVVDRYHKGFVSTWNKYKMVPAKDHPFANGKGYVMEHRLVMENNIGRALRPDELVHHIDRNKTNNDISNLMITNNSEHIQLHWREGNPSFA